MSAVCILSPIVRSSVYGQTTSKDSKALPESSAKRGYLSRPQPSGLRFAPPPKPPVAYLPPLPITYDPQPVFSPEFAQPGTEFPTQPAVTSSKPITARVASVPITDISSIFKGTKQGKIPVDTGNLGTVSPQMLVRFFEGGKPISIEIPIDNLIEGPLNFQIPVRQVKPSSSSTYELK